MKTKTLVGVKFDVIGFHMYSGAAENCGEQVKFLEFPHRHRFFFDCKKKVNHDNRDQEFIILKNEVIDWMNSRFPDMMGLGLDFGEMSCEMIAKEILNQFDFEVVEVSEDGENYAVVEKVEEKKEEIKKGILDEGKKKVVLTFVVGHAFSGKSTYARACSKPDQLVIEVGDIVREIKQDVVRVFDAELAAEITKRLASIIIDVCRAKDKTRIMIVGCRQQEIAQNLLDSLSKILDVEASFVLFLIDEVVRKQRFESARSSNKNANLSFEEINKQEKAMGLNDFILWILVGNCNKQLILE